MTMRQMFDSVTPSAIPTNAAIVAGYLAPSPYAWTVADWARFPTAVKVRVAVRASTNDGHVLDVEQGDATPTQAPGWVTMRRRAGVDPSVYCNASTWPAVKTAFRSASVTDPHYWVAQYDGVPSIPAGAVAKQYADPPNSGGNYDVSAVADYWSGVDTGGAMTSPTPDMDQEMGRVGAIFNWADRVSYAAAPTNGEVNAFKAWLVGMKADLLAAITGADADVKNALGSVNSQIQASVAAAQAAIVTAVKANAVGTTITEAQVAEIEKHLDLAFPGYTGSFTLTPQAPVA